MNDHSLRTLLLAGLFTLLLSCGDDEGPASSTEILSFSINGTEGIIDPSSNTIQLDLFEPDITSLSPSILISDNATIQPPSGVSQDFTNPVLYTVTGGDGSTEEYTVTVSSLVTSVSLNGKDYEIVQTNMNWINAADFASSRGGYLAEINGADEQDAIFGALRNAGIDNRNTVAPDGGGASYIWLGGNDLATEGEWIWDGDNDDDGMQFWMGSFNGTPVDDLYNNWSPGAEPDNFGTGQNVLAIALTDWPFGSAGQWNDIFRTNELYFIIEFD